jgi:hypothetical protein
MKTRLFLVSFLLLFLSFSAQAQNYKITESEKNFTQIDGQIVKNELNLVKFNFDFNGQVHNFLIISQSGWITFDELDVSQKVYFEKLNTIVSACLSKQKPEKYLVKYLVNPDEKEILIQWNNGTEPIAKLTLFADGTIELSYPEKINVQDFYSGIAFAGKQFGNLDFKSNEKKLFNFSAGKTYVFTREVEKIVCKGSPKVITASDYSFSTSTTTYTTVSGTNLNTIEADEETQTANIGFTFNYCGTDYTQVLVSSNGWLSFNTSISSAQLTNDLDGTTYTPSDLLAPLWDDLDGTGHGARCNTSGTAPNRKFEVEWRNWEWNYSANTKVITFKVILYESDNHIEFVYRRESGSVNNGSASIGIQDAINTIDKFSPVHYKTTDEFGNVVFSGNYLPKN